MVSPDGTIQKEYTVSGQTYEVRQTKRGASGSIWDARDTILNKTNGNKKEMTRREWKTLFDKFKK